MLDTDERKILIVEDSATMRRILQNALTRSGFDRAAEAENGKKAVDLCEKAHFDCILIDWNMPEMTGMEMVHVLRKKPEYKSTPMMMITTEAYRDDVILALSEGVNDYIIKPFTLDLFKTKMDKLMNKQ